MLTVKIPTNPYDENTPLYKKKEHQFKEGLTVLVGKNGSGKTTFLRLTEEYCKKNGIPVFTYDNYRDGGSHAISKYGFYSQTELLVTAWKSSEGEQIFLNFGSTMGELGDFVKKNSQAKELVVLFDAIDSGLDVINIAEIKDFLFNVLIKDVQSKGQQIYILLSANSYGFVEDTRCYDIVNGNDIVFSSWAEYKEFILNQKES